MSDLDVDGVIRVYVEQRRLAVELGRPVCGEFISVESRKRMHVCSLERLHSGSHR
jgi:hypothetical protein